MNKSVVALVTVGMLASCGSSWRFWEEDKNEKQKVDLTKRVPALNSQTQGFYPPQPMIDSPTSAPPMVSDYPGVKPRISTENYFNSQPTEGQQAVTEISAPVNLENKRPPAFNGSAMADTPPAPVVGVMSSPLAPSFGQPVAVTATQEFVPAPPPAPLPAPGVASTSPSDLRPIAPLYSPQISSAPLPPVGGNEDDYPMLARVQESPKVNVDVASDPRANELRNDYNSMQNQAQSFNNGDSIVVTSNRNIPTPPPAPMAGTMVPPPPSMSENAPSLPAPEYTPPLVTPQQIASNAPQLLPSGPVVVVKSKKSGGEVARNTSYSSFPTPPVEVMAQSTDVNLLRPLAAPQVASMTVSAPYTNVNSLRPLNSAPNMYIPQSQPDYGHVALAPKPALLAPPKIVPPINTTPSKFDRSLEVASISPIAAPMNQSQRVSRLLPESRYARMRMKSRDEFVREYK